MNTRFFPLFLVFLFGAIFNLESSIGREKDAQDVTVHCESKYSVATLVVMRQFFDSLGASIDCVGFRDPTEDSRFNLPFISSAFGGVSQSEPDYLNKAGYRSTRYRAPTPAEPPVGKALNTAQVQQLISENSPLLIDVQAVTVRPELADFDMDWLPSSPRFSLPGAVWLPNVGYAELSETMDHYFRSNLQQLSNGQKNKAIVIFCVVDCWLSWNAVKRAAEYGYNNLYWYSGGTDAWDAANLELFEVKPEPL